MGVRSDLCRLMSVHFTAWRARRYLSFSVFFHASDNRLNVPSTDFFLCLDCLGSVLVCNIRVDVVVAPSTSWCALGSGSWALFAETSCVVSGMAEHTMFRETCFDV